MNNRETIQELADLFIGGGFECETLRRRADAHLG